MSNSVRFIRLSGYYTTAVGKEPADLEQVTAHGELDQAKYTALYERRLLPALLHAQHVAKAQKKRAVITIPGLGCGCFAGRYRGRLGDMLRNALQYLLEKYMDLLPDVGAVYFDPYNECANERLQIGHISFLVRPFVDGNEKAQLCRPGQYAETPGEFEDCVLLSVVAWDHVSWPGNDFYIGSRATDDGVKAAATSSMQVMTGVQGRYNPETFKYEPPKGFATWQEVVMQKKCNSSPAFP